jgi:hypothetical protein
MNGIKSLIVVSMILLLAQGARAQIAITEFVNDPLGSDTDTGREWVELFNYSADSVDIMNWTIKDEDSDSLVVATTSTIIPSGGFLLYASGKSAVETDWFGGVADDRIIEYGGPNSETMQLSNSGDELLLINTSGDTVWSIAYTNDDQWDTSAAAADDGFSTYLSYDTDFSDSLTHWGSKANPGIDRNGYFFFERSDTTSTGADTTVIDSVLGYEGGGFTEDVYARLSTNGDSGSPLAGYYAQPSGKSRSNAKVAITEFLNDPLGADTDSGREYVELFNYGTEDVSVQNWSLKDEDHNTVGCCDWLVITTDNVIIPSGGYLLFASLKDTIEANYFGGVAQDDIIEYGGPNSSTMQISNSTDEFVLLDAAGDTVWNLGYINDDAYDGSTDDGFSTYLDYATDFSSVTTDWGHKNQGIVRNGPDTLVAGDPLGYEGGAFTVDSYLTQSTNGDMGSPLAGGYVALLNVDVEETLPTKFTLNQNYPNPFNPSTNISYNLGINADVTLSIYNILGQHVATLVQQQQEAGLHSVKWNAITNSGKLVSTGIYFCHIEARTEVTNYSNVIKLVYMK